MLSVHTGEGLDQLKCEPNRTPERAAKKHLSTRSVIHAEEKMRDLTRASENEDQATRAARTLALHVRENGDDPEHIDDFEIFALIANLLHLARSLGYDPFHVLERAVSHFTWEVAYENTEMPADTWDDEELLKAARSWIKRDPIRLDFAVLKAGKQDGPVH